MKTKDLVVTNVKLNKIVKYICFIVLVVELNLFRLLKLNVWHWIQIRFEKDLLFFVAYEIVCKCFKCVICLQTPVGDYYQYQNEILCSNCFNFNWQWQEKFKRTYESKFGHTWNYSFFILDIFKLFKKFVIVLTFMNMQVHQQKFK